ncbi:putative ABC transporter [Aureobasidium sp. EXF-10727]|nr:putative ABC transporter [Aureobasidium sp. EXF-10727]
MVNATWSSDPILDCGLHTFGPASCDGSFDFTLVFEQTILSIAPSVIFLCFLPVSLIKLFRRAPKFKASTIRIVKLVYAFYLCQMTQLTIPIDRCNSSHSRTDISSGVMEYSASLRDPSDHPSSVSWSYRVSGHSVSFRAVAHAIVIPSFMCLSIALKLVLVVIESWNKRSWLAPADRSLPPESTSSILSRSFLWWLNPLFVSGMRTLLDQDQLYAIDPELRARESSHKLKSAFERKFKMPKDCAEPNSVPSSVWNLPKACFRSIWTDVIAMVPTRLALVGFTFAQPFLFTRAINHLSQQNEGSYENIGYGLVGATFIIYIGIAVSNALYQQQVSRITTKLRGALISVVYDHVLVLPDISSNDGAALTLISTACVDVDTVVRVLGELNESWARLIEVAVGIGLLARQVGTVSLVPIVLTVISTQAQGWVSRRIGSRRKDWNAATQKRVSTTAVVLGSLQSVKMSGLMAPASILLHSLRVNELRMLAFLFRFIIGLNAIAVIPSIWAPVTTFMVYAIKARIDGSPGLDISQAFASLALLNLVTAPASKLLAIMPLWAQALGCFERLQHFLELPVCKNDRSPDRLELQTSDFGIAMSPILSRRIRTDLAVVCTDLDVSLSSGGPTILKSISLKANMQSFTVITGPTGSGKTVLLKSILGETLTQGGNVSISSQSISYCSQKPWMTSTTIKEYIAGLGFDSAAIEEYWYDSVIHACDLTKDFASMPDGDDTQLGSKGVSLSGGQKARLALARAVYMRRDIMLLDDVFSALDVNTEGTIIRRLFGSNGLLRRLRTTVLLVSHSQRVMSMADQILTLSRDGRMVHTGSIQSSQTKSGSSVDAPLEESARVRVTETVQARVPKGPSKEDKDDLARKTGDWSIYKYYFSNFQSRYLVMFAACSVCAAFSSRFSQIWLNWWAVDNGSDLCLYLTVYTVLALAQTVSSNLNMWVVFLKMIPGSAINMHRTLLETVAGAASSVYYQTDSGAILNRFAQDMALVIGALPTSLIATGNTLCETIASLAMISTGASYMGISIPFVILAIYAIQKVYLSTSRQLRLLEIEARSPIYSHFLETLEGVVTIRAFGWQQAAKEKQEKLLDTAQSPYYLLACVQRWLKLVLDLMVAALAVVVVGLAISQRGTTSAGLLGVALNNVLGFSQSLSRLVTEWTTLETSLGAIARVRSFATTTEREAPPTEGTTTMPQDLVTKGAVSFSGVYAKYNDDPGAYALNNISFTIPPRTKVAIFGRTSSGKSSLVLALLRLLPLQHGNISIDDTDIARVDPDVIRRSITTIPQQPFLLPGTVRDILDPEAQFSVTEVRSALQKVQLLDLVDQRGGLDEHMEQQSLSQGQAQLLCLARALLRKSKLVVLDEATSSLDTETEALIRRVLNTEFTGCTVISVAHRITTILDADVVVMMDAGRISAIGKPEHLSVSNDDFRQLCGIA